LERKPKRRRKIIRKKGVRESRAKIIERNRKYTGRVQITNGSTTSMAQETGNTVSIGRTCTDRRGRKDKYSGS